MLRLLLLYISFSLGCAQVRPLTGGEKDTIPPNIINSLPVEFSTNINPDVFFFEFDELVDASKLKEKLIISPYYDGSFDVKAKKNTISISFDSAFNKNTTYIFSFADGVVDVTEQNPSIRSKYVFSTGGVIDSSYVSGVVRDPLKNEPIKDALVGLYSEKDSLDLFHKKPIYFSSTNEDGLFKIDNVKKGRYSVYAFNDENKNFQAEFKKEKFGFVDSEVEVGESLEKIYIPLFNEDLTPLKLLRARERGSFVEVVFNKDILEYNVCCDERIVFGLTDNNILTLYQKTPINDSLLIKIKATDLYKNNLLDSFYVSFNNEIKYEHNLKTSLDLNTQNIDDTVGFTFKTNVPLLDYNINHIAVKKDTINLPVRFVKYKSKKVNNNTITGKLYVESDSVVKYIKDLKEKIIADSLSYKNDSVYRVVSNYYKKQNTSNFDLEIKKGSLYTFNKDSVDAITKELKVRGTEYYGSLAGNLSVNTDDKNYIVELINENFSETIINNKSGLDFEFKNIPPGKYLLRVIEDENNNNKWDYFSVKNKKKSERIIYYSNLIEVLSNWSIEDLVFDVNESVEKLFFLEE
tara:strand:+ start:603 stop:2333 length:1731 start_codon:yes stop_codon:yes gene_type:complete